MNNFSLHMYSSFILRLSLSQVGPTQDANSLTRKSCKKKGKVGKADQAIAYIQKLYAIEQHIKDDPPDKRYDYRQTHAKPILEKLNAWMEKSVLTVPPKTAIGKALVYLTNQWHRLVLYIDDGRYPIDNNPAERAIRPFTIGRKNVSANPTTYYP